MYRYEQVGLHPARLVHPVMQRNEIIAVAGEHGAHARFGIDACLEPARDLEGDVLFIAAAVPHRARVFAAVARVEGNRDEAADPWLVAIGR